MKKLLSLILAIAMVISLIPSVFADDTTTAPADVVYDFTSLEKGWKQANGTEGKNFAFNTSGQSGWKVDDPANGNYLKLAVNTDWDKNNGTSRKAAIDLTVPKDGWYTPSFTGGLTQQNMKASIYLGTTYIGDYDFSTDDKSTSNVKCIIGSEKRLNSVFLTAGTHTVWFCFRAGTNGGYPFFINFKLYGLSEEPRIDVVDSKVPTEVLDIGATETLTAQVVDSNGNAISYADYTINSSSSKLDEPPTTYLEITSDNDGVVQVSNVAKGGLCNSENTIYTIEAVGGGVANLIFTPYIGGVAQTSYTKSVSVAGPITVDFSKSEDKANKTPGYTVGPYGQSSDSWRKSKCGTMMRVLQVHQNYTTWHEEAKKQNMLSFKVNVPEAGFYNIKLQGGLTAAGGIMSIYANGNYAGDYDFHTDDTTLSTDREHGVVGPEKALNTVYLSSGENIIFMGLRKSLSTYADTRIFLRKLTLTPVDSLAGETAIDVKTVSSTDVPATMTVRDSIDATATVTMEDDSVRSFAEYKLSGTTAVADTIDSVTVTSSAPAIISVENVEDDALGASDKTTFTLRANKAGSANITITAKVGDSTKTATYTVTVPDDKPGEVVTDTMVNFKASAYEGGSVSNDKVQDIEVGKNVTVTATPNTGYTFAYWKNSAGVVLSTSATETFKVNTNMGVIAVFDEIPTDDAIPVYFYNGNGLPLAETTVTKDTTFADAKTKAGVSAKPTLTGFVFDKWSVDDGELITALTRAVALYEDDANTKFTVKNGDVTVASGLKYGESVTVNGSDSFVCWKLGDKVISYEKDYTFDAYGNITLTEVTEGTVEKAPVLVLDKVGGNYFLTYDEGDYELVEAGILFGDGNVNIGSTNGYKAAAKKGTGQFTAQPHEGATESTIARGYMIFKDGNDLRVAYSD